MSLIKRLFGGAKQPDLTAPLQSDATPLQPEGRPPDTKFVEVDSQATTRRELVRVMTRDTLRFSGIPEGWIESQVLLELSRGGQTFVHLRLVVKHWDERLLKYAVAFQRRLLGEVERFEPTAREWLLSITWQYPLEGECPYLEMPEPATWVNLETVDIEVDEVGEDLARLFAVRDAHLAESGAGHLAPAGTVQPKR